MMWYTRFSKLGATSVFNNYSNQHLLKQQKHSFSNHLGGYKSPPPLIISSKYGQYHPNNLYKHNCNTYGGQAWRKTISFYAPTKTCNSQQIIPSWVYKCIAGYTLFILVVVPVGVVLYNTYETIPYTNRTHFVLLPPSNDKFIGEAIYKKMELGLLPEEHPDSVRVKSIGEQIVKALESDLEAIKGKKPTVDHLVGLKWEFLVVNDTKFTETCVSVPGGKIYVSSDMLKHLESDADIATLIGHEVGHVVARHVPGRLNMLVLAISAYLYLGLPISIPNKIVNNPDGAPGLGRLLFTYPTRRREEMEADYIGLLLMASAGFDPQEAPKVYEMLDQLSPSTKFDFYLTHPSGKKRAKALAKVMEEAKSIYSETSVTRKKIHEDC